jgi:hypothetical protein
MDNSTLTYLSSMVAPVQCLKRDNSLPCRIHNPLAHYRRARVAALSAGRQRPAERRDEYEPDVQLELITLRAEPTLARLAWEAAITDLL